MDIPHINIHSMEAIDAGCRTIQTAVSQLLYGGKPLNSFDPAKATKQETLEDGSIFINDIRYGNDYANSYFDLWYPDATKSVRPTVIYLHGGGMIFGDKASGDPLAVKKDGSGNMLRSIVKAGYNLINANYALAPEYRFPVQLHQVNQLVKYLQDHAEELSLDMTRVIMMGGSAGADLTELYAACVTNPLYAEKIGVTPVLKREHFRVAVMDEAALDASFYSEGVHALLSCWLKEKSVEMGEKTQMLNAMRYITSDFIPSFINASNVEDVFRLDAQELDCVLASLRVEHEYFFRDRGHGDLPHGYMSMLDTNPWAKEAFDHMMTFISQHIN